jgi:hypothetical protein
MLARRYLIGSRRDIRLIRLAFGGGIYRFFLLRLGFVEPLDSKLPVQPLLEFGQVTTVILVSPRVLPNRLV